MKLSSFVIGTTILSKYCDGCDLCPIPNSFPNGAPDFSHRAYLSVEIGNQWVSDEDEKVLRENGWVPEDDGQVWVIYS